MIALDGGGSFIKEGDLKSDLYLGCILLSCIIKGKILVGFSPLVGFPSKYLCLLFFVYLDIDPLIYAYDIYTDNIIYMVIMLNV